MYRILRIICCVISVMFAAACVFVFIYLGTAWGIVFVVGAAAFFGLTLLFKSLQEDGEGKKDKSVAANNKESASVKEEEQGKPEEPAREKKPEGDNPEEN